LVIHSSRRLLVKDDGLKGGYFDGFAATWILAAQFVVQTDPVVAGFGEPGPVSLISARGQRSFLGPMAPSYRVFEGLTALGTIDLGSNYIVSFIEKVPLFHSSGSLSQKTIRLARLAGMDREEGVIIFHTKISVM
jgi:hypothetical protein